MRLKQMTSTLLLTVGMLSLAAPMGASADAAAPSRSAGATRVISTAGLQRFDVGGGAAVYTNTPGAVTFFGWNTGSSSGSVTSLSSPSVTTIGR